MTGRNEEKIVACGPSHRSQYGELTDNHVITKHSSHAAMRVVALTEGFIPESYFPRYTGGDPWAFRDSLWIAPE
jgi:hypothetical protein